MVAAATHPKGPTGRPFSAARRIVGPSLKEPYVSSGFPGIFLYIFSGEAGKASVFGVTGVFGFDFFFKGSWWKFGHRGLSLRGCRAVLFLAAAPQSIPS
jgi:hypothetical protein